MFSLFNAEEIESLRKEQKLDPYRIKQMYTAVFKQAIIDFEDITTLSKEMKTFFAEHVEICPLQLDQCIEDDEIVKFLFKTHDGKIVETVLMYHYDQRGRIEEGTEDNEDGPNKKINRMTLCVSSQVGCPVGCVFCVTGKLGLLKNLSMDEILGQILFVNNYIKQKRGKKPDGTLYTARNIVFMGMGEPLLNYDAVKATIPYLTDVRFLGLSRKHVTVSTSGITPGIKRFTADNLPVSFAFSLHAPTQQLREKLVPFAKQFPLDGIMEAIDEYTRISGTVVFYEYVMIKDINDTDDCAHATGKLLQRRKAHLNLIPYNENPAIDLQEPSNNRIRTFQKIVESYRVTVTVRGNMGRKSKGACGQLGRDSVQKKGK